MGKQQKQCQTLFWGAPKSLQMVTAAMKLKDAYSLEEKLWPTQTAYSKTETLLCQQRSVLVKAMVFPVVMYACESWTVKKAEWQRIAAFELWCWRRLLRVPRTARRSNQSIQYWSILGVHWKEWCWGWNSNTLATSCEGTGWPGVLWFMGPQRVGHSWATELKTTNVSQLQNLKYCFLLQTSFLSVFLKSATRVFLISLFSASLYPAQFQIPIESTSNPLCFSSFFYQSKLIQTFALISWISVL